MTLTCAGADRREGLRLRESRSPPSSTGCESCPRCAGRSGSSARATLASQWRVKTGLNVAERENILPTSLPPRGLSRVQSAAYIGVSATLFDELVRDGRMPQPIRLNSRLVWDRLQLDDAFVALSDIATDGNDPWSKVAV